MEHKNILLNDFQTVFQTVPFDKIKTDDYLPAFKDAISIARNEIDNIIKSNEQPGFANTLETLEHSGELLGRMEAVFFNLLSAETNSEMQQIAQEISPILSDFNNDIMLNEVLFKKVKTVYESSEKDMLNPEEKKLLEDTYKNFVRRGANLSPEKKETFRKVTRELSQLTLKFSDNVLAETNNFELHLINDEEVSGIPADILEAAAQTANEKGKNGWVFTLHFPSYGPFMKFADRRDLREKMYRAYNSRGFKNNDHDNQQIVLRVVELRLEMIRLLGYRTYAEFILENRMAQTPEKVNTFLSELLEASMPAAQDELAELSQFASENEASFALQPWDWAYYSEKLKKKKYDYDEEMIKPYFQLENVREGIFGLAQQLYGLHFSENAKIPVYHPDVKTYEVADDEGNQVAILYLDFFPRVGKQGGAWMTAYREQYKKDGMDVRPHVSLVFNFSKPTATKPSLLTYYEVTTFLHEFGHALHGMLSNCTYQSLSGTNVYRDFVELPSQLLENWAEQKEWLDKVAVHYKTGEKIPDDLLKRILDSNKFQNGYSFVRQLNFGILDMAWHTVTKPVDIGVNDFEKEVTKHLRILPPVEGCNISTAFSHIFSGGYAAGYYGYKWAEVLDADAFSVFKEKGIFDKDTATLFRKNILERGGTEHPMTLYKKFRGKEPSVKSLLQRSGLKYHRTDVSVDK